MIKLSDAELISALPYYIKNNVDVQAVSYAFKMGMEKMLGFAKQSSLYGNLDVLPEDILDLLAIEMQSQYYDESMDISVKRNIIKNSLAWYEKGGTVSAVNEVIQTVFGEGNVLEWHEFNGEPGTFSIETNAELSPDTIKRFEEIVEKIKNKRSHLVNVKINRKINQTIFSIIQCRCTPHYCIRDNGLNNVRQVIYSTMKTLRQNHITIKEKEG